MFRYKRSARVQELLREEISQYINTFHDSFQGLVTITEVKLSDDLSHARLFVSVMGNDEQKKQTIQILDEHIKDLRRFLGKKLTLKRIPEIHIVEDNTAEKASRIFSILDQIRSEKEEDVQKRCNNNEKSA